MWIGINSVEFEAEDMHFVKKVGLEAATQMVLRHRENNRTPFLYDTHQLSVLLSVPHSELLRVIGDIPSFYRLSQIKKRSGGFREISEPMFPLNVMQKMVLLRILYQIKPSPYACAYFPGASLTRNAYPHVGKRFLLKMDITDFFGSIRSDMVCRTVFDESRFPKEIGETLTALCCLHGALPQGTSTSPALSNLVMRDFDAAFGSWCLERKLRYTRYCDDITVSGNTSLYPAYQKAKELLSDSGFVLNEKKTRFITNASRQTVTGLCVNEKLSVPSDYKRALRQELYYVNKFGIADVIKRQRLKAYEGPGGCAEYYHHLMGRLNYILSVEWGNRYFLNAKSALCRQREAIFSSADEG